MVGLLTGHCHLKGHLFKMGLTDDPSCERCLEEDESATHILCDCEAITNLRFRHLGQFFYGAKWLLWRPHKFHSKCRINKGLIKRGSTIDHWRSRCKGRISGPPLIHTYIITHQLLHSSSLIQYSWQPFWRYIFSLSHVPVPAMP
jgi:hypothetical protein